jgi:glycine/D-amino acid oxidase-like deaminating enzyme
VRTPTVDIIDALVVGGGVVGLFTAHALRQRGCSTLVVEREALGTGQTTSSQGILHAGVKYSLGGRAGEDAREASEAAARWTDFMDGSAGPDLRGLRVLTRSEYLWRSTGLMGVAGMLGARLALRTRPEAVGTAERPAWLEGVQGDVLTLSETVIDPADLLSRLAAPMQGSIGLGTVGAIRLTSPDQVDVTVHEPGGARTEIRARRVFLCAGAGNESLIGLAGLGLVEPMQRRPLRQAMVRGPLPMVFGHCIDGAKTRVTITSDAHGDQTVWHVGGELAEHGPDMAPEAFLHKARHELSACLPAIDFRACEWSSYMVDRAEPRTREGRRPSRSHVRAHGPIVAVWPVKLVLAPRAADEAAGLASTTTGDSATWPSGWPVPRVATRPWDHATWSRLP